MAYTVETRGLNEISTLLHLCADEFPKILKISINHAVDRSRTAAWREVTAKYTMKQEAFYKRYSRFKASQASLSGRVFIDRKPAVALHEFKTSITKKGVKVTIAKATGAKLIGGSFHMRGDKTQPVFLRAHQRSGLVLNSMDPEVARKIPWKRLVQEGKLDKKARLPIKKLYSLSAAQVVDDGSILGVVLEKGAIDFQTELARQIDRIFG
jgi:hypothetical protein